MLYATVLAFLLSFLDRRDRMGPRGSGRRWSPARAACCRSRRRRAAAGIIVAVISLTGLGLELSSLIVDAAGGSLALTAIFARSRC